MKNNKEEKEEKVDDMNENIDHGNSPCTCINSTMFPHRKKKCALKGPTATAFGAGVNRGVAIGGTVVGAAYTSLLAAPAVVGHAAVAGVSQGIARGVSQKIEDSIMGRK